MIPKKDVDKIESGIASALECIVVLLAYLKYVRMAFRSFEKYIYIS